MGGLQGDNYRPGKRVGHVAVAHRAGAGDIISWSHANYTEPTPAMDYRKSPVAAGSGGKPPAPNVRLSVEGHGPGGFPVDVSPLHGHGGRAGGDSGGGSGSRDEPGAWLCSGAVPSWAVVSVVDAVRTV